MKRGTFDVESPASSESLSVPWFQWRTFAGFWLLGACNNYVYNTMLSAAYDVIAKVELNENNTQSSVLTSTKNTFARECSETSTGAILMADITPAILCKIIFPFLPFLVNFQLAMVIISGIVALVWVAYADTMLLALVGVCFASINFGIGEVTLLSYTSLFPSIALSAWSSGTGAAGIVGAFAYTGMTEAGFTLETAFFVSITVPVIMAVSFWIILKHPARSAPLPEYGSATASQSEETLHSTSENKWKTMHLKLINNMKSIPELVSFMIPVGLVYYFEYLINSGLFELLVFENTSLDRSSQFRWYNVLYQVGVFVSRSSVAWIHLKKIWIMALLQGVNIIVLSLEAMYGFIPNIWIMFVIIFWEGLLGGAAYANTFYNMSYMIPKERQIFALGIVSVADALGILFASLTSFPVHDSICSLQYNPTYRWPSS